MKVLLSGHSYGRTAVLAAALVSVALLALSCSPSTAVPSTSDGAQAGNSMSSDVASNVGVLGPTADELNTIAVIERYGPSTAALSVVVGGQSMLPSVLEGGEVPDDVLPRVDGGVQRSSGSGFVIDVDGVQFLVTNFHVVQEALEVGTSTLRSDSTVTATFVDSVGEVPLGVVGVNPSFDLALLEPTSIDQPLPAIESIPIGDSDLVVKGQKTIAIGNPFSLGSTATSGIVSSIGRLVPSVGEVSVPMIQTDAAVNPGNSGGALLNSSGELIGINTAIFNPEARAFAGIGFAVPSGLLVEALANLELGGVSSFSDTRPTFGAQLGTLSLLPQAIRAEAGFPDVGVVVLDVAPGGPAADAGLRMPEFTEVMGVPVPVDPDIIVAVDGRQVNTAEDLNVAISYESDIGQEVELTVMRSGDEVLVSVLLGGE